MEIKDLLAPLFSDSCLIFVAMYLSPLFSLIYPPLRNTSKFSQAAKLYLARYILHSHRKGF